MQPRARFRSIEKLCANFCESLVPANDGRRFSYTPVGNNKIAPLVRGGRLYVCVCVCVRKQQTSARQRPGSRSGRSRCTQKTGGSCNVTICVVVIKF
jgi:hypothetical protein